MMTPEQLIEKAIIQNQHEIVSSDIDDILNGIFDREMD